MYDKPMIQLLLNLGAEGACKNLGEVQDAYTVEGFAHPLLRRRDLKSSFLPLLGSNALDLVKGLTSLL